MTMARAVVGLLVVSVALTLQVSLFPHLAWQGIVPNLCLLVVVGAALTRGPQFAAVLGLLAGVALDLAPPADHAAGRWALALVLVGWLAGRMRRDGRAAAVTVVATVAAASFVGTSVFQLTGLVLADPLVGVPEVLQAVLVGVVWDLALTPFVLPPVMTVFSRLEPGREAVR